MIEVYMLTLLSAYTLNLMWNLLYNISSANCWPCFNFLTIPVYIYASTCHSCKEFCTHTVLSKHVKLASRFGVHPGCRSEHNMWAPCDFPAIYLVPCSYSTTYHAANLVFHACFGTSRIAYVFASKSMPTTCCFVIFCASHNKRPVAQLAVVEK